MNPLPPKNHGWIEVITGTMFGGKSTELVRRLERSLIADQEVLAFSKDSRFEKGNITTHKKNTLKGHFVENSQEIDSHIEKNRKVEVIGIDEIQFFDHSLVDLCNKWALRGKRIICAGLDQDYEGKAFETTSSLVVEAEYVDKMLAICTSCGNPAVRNHLKVKNGSRIIEGSQDKYTALCRHCFMTKNNS